jgi:hypothetical protein
MSDFNRGSDSFTRILNPKDLVKGNNYLIRVRVDGKPREDFIAQFSSSSYQTCFMPLYERSPRYNDGDEYNKWKLYSGASLCIDDVNFNKNNKDDNTVYSLGEDGNKITRQKSPDAVREEIIKSEQKSIDHFATKKGSLSALPYDMRRTIKSFLGPTNGPTGGKTKRKRRHNKINKKRRTNKRKLKHPLN